MVSFVVCQTISVSKIDQPRNVRSVRTRSAVLDAAWDLLETVGPEKTTMTAVAETAGISRRGLYLHFESRAQLLSAVIERRNEVLDLEGSIRPVVEAHDSVTALREFVRHLVGYHSQIKPVVQAVARARRSDPDAAVMWRHAMSDWQAGCNDLAERLAEEGKLAPYWSVAAAGEALWSLMISFNDLWESLVEESEWTTTDFRSYLEHLHMSTFVTPADDE